MSKAIEIEPEHKRAFASRGETYRLMRKYQLALADFTDALKLDSDFVWALASRGETYHQMKQLDKALADIN